MSSLILAGITILGSAFSAYVIGRALITHYFNLKRCAVAGLLAGIPDREQNN